MSIISSSKNRLIRMFNHQNWLGLPPYIVEIERGEINVDEKNKTRIFEIGGDGSYGSTLLSKFSRVDIEKQGAGILYTLNAEFDKVIEFCRKDIGPENVVITKDKTIVVPNSKREIGVPLTFNCENNPGLPPYFVHRPLLRGESLYFDRDVIINVDRARIPGAEIDGQIEQDVTIISDGSIAFVNSDYELASFYSRDIDLKAGKDILFGRGYVRTLEAGRHLYCGPGLFQDFSDEQVLNIFSQSFEGMSDLYASRYALSADSDWVKAGGMVKIARFSGKSVDAGETIEIKFKAYHHYNFKQGKPVPIPLPEVKKIFSAEATRLAEDPRILIASCVEEFSRMKEDDTIRAMIMPNPVPFPTDPEEIAAIMAATKKVSDHENLVEAEMGAKRLPDCIRKTARVMSEAYKYASHKENPSWYKVEFRLAQGRHFPDKPFAYSRGNHQADFGITLADIFGSTAVFYKGTAGKPGEGYSLPARHIAVFKDIVHMAGDRQPGVPKLTMQCSRY